MFFCYNRFFKKLQPFKVIEERLGEDSLLQSKTVQSHVENIRQFFNFVAHGSYAQIYGNANYVVRHARYNKDDKCNKAVKDDMTRNYPFQQGLLCPISIYRLFAEQPNKTVSIHSFELYVRLPKTLQEFAVEFNRVARLNDRKRYWTDLMRDGISALEYLHNKYNCMHGDISSSNLYMDFDGNKLMIGDWDILLHLYDQPEYLLGSDSSIQLPISVYAHMLNNRYLINSLTADFWALTVTVSHSLWSHEHFFDKIEALKSSNGDACETCDQYFPMHQNTCTYPARRLQFWMCQPQITADQIATTILNHYAASDISVSTRTKIFDCLKRALTEGKVRKLKTDCGTRDTITFLQEDRLITVSNNNGTWIKNSEKQKL